MINSHPENTLLNSLTQAIQKKIHDTFGSDIVFHSDDSSAELHSHTIEIINEHCDNHELEVKKRIEQEFLEFGPLTSLISDEEITEILVNGPISIWFEKSGKLIRYHDVFLSEVTFRNVIDKLLAPSQLQPTINHPSIDTFFRNFRLTLVSSELTQSSIHISLRRHPKNPWSFKKLVESNWCTPEDAYLIKDLVSEKENFIIIGGTGSGKTSILNACLNFIGPEERVITIEDTPEISLPNEASMKLLTRIDGNEQLKPIMQSDLVKKSLRLRPDRIVMGEIRGEEAKDYLMALSTGHTGSISTIHAQNPHQALIRLEMLIQLGAPEWGTHSIRRLIQLSLQYIIVTEKDISGQRKFKGIYKIASLEDYGFTLEKINP